MPKTEDVARTTGVTVTKGEFNRFWDEVLGSSWFVDEWDVDNDALDKAGDDHTVTITVLERGWQGVSDPATNEYLTDADLQTQDTLPVLRRWLDRQPMRRVSAWVPQSAVAEFTAFVTRVGGQTG